MPPEAPTIEWWPTLPLLVLAGTAIVILLVDVLRPQRRAGLSLFLALIGMGAALVILSCSHVINSWGHLEPDGFRRVTGQLLRAVGEWKEEAFGGFLVYDYLGQWGAIIALTSGCLVALVSLQTIRFHRLPPAEYFALLLFAVLGMVLLAISRELLTMFLAVEIIAVSIYILVGLRPGCSRSAEAALKYFILGAFSSGFLIFGFAFVYGGAGGNTFIDRMGDTLLRIEPRWMLGCLVLGLALALAGFAFKITLVPFHLYAADVYEGAPTPIAALLATGAKVAGLVALVHLLGPLKWYILASLRTDPDGLFAALVNDMKFLVWVLAALSIVVGNTVALRQRNIKRMLAYSSIAHSGYLMIGVLVLVHGRFADGRMTETDVQQALLAYLLAYVFMSVTAFGVASTLGKRGEENIEDYAGLARRSPGLAFAMALAMLSLIGIPGTVGFVGKFYLFRLGVEMDLLGICLVIVAVLGSVVSAYYYLRVVVCMYMKDADTEIEPEPVGAVQSLGLLLATVPIVGFGILPQSLLRLLGG